MDPKDITVFTLYRFADWGLACSPSMLFQFHPANMPLCLVQIMVLLLVIGAIWVAVKQSAPGRVAFQYCILIAVACLALGVIETYREYRAAMTLFIDAQIQLKPEELREGAPSMIAPSILGGIGMVACLAIGLATLLRRPRPNAVASEVM